MSSSSTVRMCGIVKRFPGVRAVDRVDLELRAGEIHALVGENGAGKSTLVKVLTGVYRPDEGHIEMDDHAVSILSPADAERLGILCIHQEPSLVPHFDIACNIYLGREGAFGSPFLARDQIYRAAREVLARLEIDLDPKKSVSDLSIGEQEMVGICRALARSPRVFVLDEPTAALTSAEVGRLFGVLRRLRDEGVSILYISHRMEEIFEIANSVSVMRDGKMVATIKTAETSTDEVVQLMIGRGVLDFYPKTPVDIGQELLSVKDLAVSPGGPGVSFTVHAGEIVGIYGLLGAGQTELAYTLVGVREKTRGFISVGGRRVNITSPAEALRHGLALVSRERRDEGLVLGMTVKENVTLAALRQWSPRGLIDFPAERRAAEKQVQALTIRTAGLRQAVRYLSGGNQQKVVLGKWLAE